VRHLTLALLTFTIAWLYVRSTKLAGLATPIPAAPIAAVLAAIALAGEMLATRLQTALPIGSVQLVVVAVVATMMLIEWGWTGGGGRPAAAAAEPDQSSGLNR
jgi:hypothetical protein